MVYKILNYIALFFWWVAPFSFIFFLIFALRNAMRDQFNRNFFLQSIGAAVSLLILNIGSNFIASVGF